MNEIIVKENKRIENLIYEVRGKQVMIDRDLENLYGCKNGTKTVNQAVKRHINRFPERFMFQLTKEEYNNILRSQIGTANGKNENMSRTFPYVFTEEGVAMLAIVLRTNVAEEVSVAIMDAFVAMKKYISSNLLEQRYINNMVLKHDNELIKRYKIQYENLEIFQNNTFYDRFIIIDNKGASFKKCFALNKIDNIECINKINEYIKDTKK